MKVTLNWLKEYVDFDGTPEKLADQLTMLGVEVEGIKKTGASLEGVVVAQILAFDKHPNADKLSLCRVADGTGERQIVCGAKNFKAGDKVPLALPGTTLPTPPGSPPFTIKVGKIRGVESQGMLCSPDELGFGADVDGLLILPQDAVVGQPLTQSMGLGGPDVIFDLEITPNRPDLNSVIGIARELAAVNGKTLRLPKVDFAKTDATAPIESLVHVTIEKAELCPRYVARVIRNIMVRPSPDWLKQRLEQIGIRPINNIVDITNFVMMETGQPLHAFDYHLLDASSGVPEIVVRLAAEGEKFKTLDGQERNLTPEMLLIADRKKAIALAGVMGGENSEIQEQTKDVLLESASFQSQNIRRTAKKLDLHTDASYRFERGSDVEMCEWASHRAAALMVELAGGSVVGSSADVYPGKTDRKTVGLRHWRVEKVLGVDVPAAAQIDFLTRLGLEKSDVADASGQQSTFVIPSFRSDLKGEIDLIEEVTRLYGVERIPSTVPRGGAGSHPFHATSAEIEEAKSILCALGLNEAQGQTLISDKAAVLAQSKEALVFLSNPLSSDMNVLRASLLPGLLESTRHNLHRKTADVGLFEIGKVFTKQAGTSAEERRIGVLITGDLPRPFWKGGAVDGAATIFDLKGMLEIFLERFGVRGVTYVRQAEAGQPWIESASIFLGKQMLGQIGQISPIIGRDYDLRAPAFAVELNFEWLLARRVSQKSYKKLPAFPSIRRDIAMFVPDAATHEIILTTIRQLKPANLESIDLFDLFKGNNVPTGQKSMAYALIYRSSERTLTDSEVNAAHQLVVDALKSKVGATVRE